MRLQEESVMKEKAIEDTQIGSMHEMGEMRRAQELRVDEFSIQKLSESYETIQRLTSQVQELQERMYYLNDSGEFHEAESNCSGKNSHVPSQPARIPSPRSKHGIHLDYRKTFFFFFCKSTLDARLLTSTSSRNHPCMTPNAAVEAPALISTGKRVAREDERVGSTIPMSTFARRPADYELLCSYGYSTEFYGWAAKTAHIGTSILTHSTIIFNVGK